MKVALAPGWRNRMLALVPAGLGVGTSTLWARSLRWPRNVDADGLTLGYRKVASQSVERIVVWRSYRDGHVSRLDIHHHGSVDKLSVRALRDRETIAGTILARFKEVRRARRSSGESRPD
jgi:hypothetical protein